ncbi:TBC1 domain family member 24-like [Gastrophryne carolinensis]
MAKQLRLSKPKNQPIQLKLQGLTTANPLKIVEAFKTFLADLYSNPGGNNPQKLEEFFSGIELPVAPRDCLDSMEEPITLQELLAAIKTIKPKKTPGPDGFSGLYYKKFAPLLGPHLVALFNSLRSGMNPSPESSMANIVMIPKPEKDPLLTSNYRPISLLNQDVKLLAKILASRLNSFLGSLVHRDQSGFVPSRQASDNVRPDLGKYCDYRYAPPYFCALEDLADLDLGSCPPPIIITPGADAWDIDLSSYADCGHFVDWDQFPTWPAKRSPSPIAIPHTMKELKRMAREGAWASHRSLRAEAYNHIIRNINSRACAPNASVYHDVAERLFGNGSAAGGDHPLPEFMDGCPAPTYCLNARGESAVRKVLICVGNQYPDITYCPSLPAVAAILMHFSEDEAECFERLCRLVSCTDPHKSYIEQSFLSFEASNMTFGDLAKKYCPAAHKFIIAHCDNAAEVFSDWLTWTFGDLPFKYAIRVFDVFLLEGTKVLYRVGLALLKHYKLCTDYSGQDVRFDIQDFVRNIAEHICVEKLLDKAFSIRLFSHKEIWLLHMANRKALAQSGITVMQPRQPTHMAVDMLNFTSEIVSAQEMRLIWSWIPERFSLYSPVLLFSTLEHGYSLQSFYSHCEGSEPTVLLIRTTANEVCGAYLSSDWNERRKCCGQVATFFGTGECFVFTMRPEVERHQWVVVKKPEMGKEAPPSPRSRPRSYSLGAHLSPSSQGPASLTPSSAPSSSPESSNFLSVPGETNPNRLSPFLSVRHFQLPTKTASMFMSGNSQGLIIGGGGGQALNIDADLNIGRTEHCETFDNPPLCQENFHIQNLEVWGCQHS